MALIGRSAAGDFLEQHTWDIPLTHINTSPYGASPQLNILSAGTEEEPYDLRNFILNARDFREAFQAEEKNA
ncbi:MAG TPA: hypothetical protein VIY66_01100 [Candidatus Acidoferrales bacterium]